MGLRRGPTCTGICFASASVTAYEAYHHGQLEDYELPVRSGGGGHGASAAGGVLEVGSQRSEVGRKLDARSWALKTADGTAHRGGGRRRFAYFSHKASIGPPHAWSTCPASVPTRRSRHKLPALNLRCLALLAVVERMHAQPPAALVGPVSRLQTDGSWRPGLTLKLQMCYVVGYPTTIHRADNASRDAH